MARPPPLLLVVVAMPPVWTAVLQTALPQHTPAQLILREPSTVHAVALVQASGASDCNDPAALRILTTSSVDSCAEVQCTTEWDLGTASTGHYLLCVSRDEGASWVFADGYGADPGRLVAVQGVVSSFDQMYSLVPKRGESSSDVRRQEPPVDLTHVSGSFAAGTELSISRALDCAVAAGTAAVAVAPLATPQNGCPDESCASSFLLNDNSRGLAVSASKTGVPYWVCYRPSGSSVRVNTGIRLWVQDALTSFPSQLDLKVSLHTLDLGQSSLRTVVLGFPPLDVVEDCKGMARVGLFTHPTCEFDLNTVLSTTCMYLEDDVVEGVTKTFTRARFDLTRAESSSMHVCVESLDSDVAAWLSTGFQPLLRNPMLYDITFRTIHRYETTELVGLKGNYPSTAVIKLDTNLHCDDEGPPREMGPYGPIAGASPNGIVYVDLSLMEEFLLLRVCVAADLDSEWQPTGITLRVLPAPCSGCKYHFTDQEGNKVYRCEMNGKKFLRLNIDEVDAGQGICNLPIGLI